MMEEQAPIRSARFRREREGGWTRLAALLDRVDRNGVRSLSFSEAHELTALYRHTVNSLAVAREVSLDAGLLIYLEALAARAYLALYAPQSSLSGLVERFFLQGAPRAMRRAWPQLLVAFLLMAGAGGAGFALVMADASWYHSIMPPGMAQGRGPRIERGKSSRRHLRRRP